MEAAIPPRVPAASRACKSGFALADDRSARAASIGVANGSQKGVAASENHFFSKSRLISGAELLHEAGDQQSEARWICDLVFAGHDDRAMSVRFICGGLWTCTGDQGAAAPRHGCRLEIWPQRPA